MKILYSTIYQSYKNMIELLLNQSIYIDIMNESHEKMLIEMIENDYKNMIALLLRYDANIDIMS